MFVGWLCVVYVFVVCVSWCVSVFCVCVLSGCVCVSVFVSVFVV